MMSYFLQWLEPSFYFYEGKAQNYLCVTIFKDLIWNLQPINWQTSMDKTSVGISSYLSVRSAGKSPLSTGAFFFVRPLSYLMFWFYRTSSDPAPVVYAIQDHPRVHRHHSLPVNQVINTAHSLKKTLRSPFKGHVSFGNKKLRTWPECWSQAALGCWAG